MPLVTIKIISDDPIPVPVDGVVLEFYDAVTAVFQTTGTTDISGQASVSLPSGDYDVAFYRIGLNILPRQPQRLTVDPTLSNTFQVVGHLRTRPESIDPLKCTVSGSIVGVDGKQAKHRLIFEPVKTITILSGMVIAPYSRREIPSTEDGYFEFELLRNTKYNAFFVFPQDLFGTQPGKLDVVTPDLPGVDIGDLLFPVPVRLSFSVQTISLVSGSSITDETTQVTAVYSDGSIREVLSTPWAGVEATNTNADVVEASIADAKILRLKPLRPGTAVVSTVRKVNDRAFFDPIQDFITDTVVVTVT